MMIGCMPYNMYIYEKLPFTHNEDIKRTIKTGKYQRCKQN